MTYHNPVGGWAYEPADPAAYQSTGYYYHEDCPKWDENAKEIDSIVEWLSRIETPLEGGKRIDFTIQHTCRFCGATMQVHEVDYEEPQED